MQSSPCQKCERVQVIDMRTKREIADSAKTVLTSPVRRVCEPVVRHMVALGPAPPLHIQQGRFTVLTYNILADLYTTTQQFPTTEAFALQWQYRRQVILKELSMHDADIVCLQVCFRLLADPSIHDRAAFTLL